MSQDLSLLDPSMWPESSDEGFHAMRVLPGTGPRNEVLRMIEGVDDKRIYQSVSKDLRDAIECLNQLDPGERIGVGYGGNTATISAISALQRLVTALQAEGEDLGIDLPPLNAYLADPPKLRDDLREVTAEFLRYHLADDLAKLCTFSLILFRDTDFDGSIAKSLAEQRPQWRDALTPANKTGNDLHLAVIPPPSASIGISGLAKELHCLQLLPCVIFLGNKPDRSLSSDNFLSRLSARRLQVPPPGFPEQLHAIYRTVYNSPARGGSLWMGAGDKYVQLIREKINLRVAFTLIIGAIGGPACVQAFNTLSPLFMK
jgi:hypothetical protein